MSDLFSGAETGQCPILFCSFLHVWLEEMISHTWVLPSHSSFASSLISPAFAGGWMHQSGGLQPQLTPVIYEDLGIFCQSPPPDHHRFTTWVPSPFWTTGINLHNLLNPSSACKPVLSTAKAESHKSPKNKDLWIYSVTQRYNVGTYSCVIITTSMTFENISLF